MRESLREAVATVLAAHPDVVGAYLFGSRDRGEPAPGSDVDLAIVFRDPVQLERLVRLEDELETALGLPVDVVDLAHAGAFLALEAVRGERLFERDGRRLDELDLFILRRAGELARFERERRQALLATGEK